jgi:hypothetical protein
MKSAEQTGRMQASLPTYVIAAEQIGELRHWNDRLASVFYQVCNRFVKAAVCAISADINN